MDIQIFDNGGKTYDRYCLIVDNEKVYTLADEPLSPRSIRYLCEAVDLDRKEAGRLILLEDLPKQLIVAIEQNLTIWFGKEAA